MNGGEQDVGRTDRLDAEETVARLVECPGVNPSPLVQRTDSSSDLGCARDRRRNHLGRLATRQVVVLPQLERRMGSCAISLAFGMKGGPAR